MLGTGCASGSRAGNRDAGADAVRGAQDTDSISFTLPDSSCPPALESEQARQIQDAALQAASCFSGDIWFSEPSGLQVVPSLTSLGADVLYLDCAQQDAGPGLSDRMADWATQVKNAIAGLDHTCLAQPGHISVPVEGGSHTQLQQILDAQAPCGEHVGGSLVLVLDANGALVGVSGTPAEVSSCMLAALNGLTFPCLSGSRICEEYICIE